MRATGMLELASAESFSLAGWAWLARSAVRVAWQALRYFGAVSRFAPDLALVIDAPGLHRPLLRRLRARGTPVAWIAPPQLWAWPGRREDVLADLDVFPLHEFELPSLRAQGARARWVGYLGPSLPQGHPDRNRLALLPGTRPLWRRRHLDLFLEAAYLAGLPLEAVVAAPDGVVAGRKDLQVQSPEDLYPRAALALAMPGTGALELARLQVPTLLAAKPGRLDLWIARSRLDRGTLSLANRILGQAVQRELYGADLTAPLLARELQDQWEGRSRDQGRLVSLEGRLEAICAPDRLVEDLAKNSPFR